MTTRNGKCVLGTRLTGTAIGFTTTNHNIKVTRVMKRENQTSARTYAMPAVLKKLLCVSVVGALGAFAPAQASVITFDEVENVVSATLGEFDSAYNTGDMFLEGHYAFQVNNSPTADAGEYGGVGAQINAENDLACTVLSCPNGGTNKYYAGINDGTLSISRSWANSWFRLNSLQFAFIAPVVGLADFSYGRLVLTGTTQSGATISTSSDFPGQDASGTFTFGNFALDPVFSNTILSSLTINTCMYNFDGACSMDRPDTQNQAQFALDNLDLSEVPEPASIGLMLLGFAGLSAARRRAGK